MIALVFMCISWIEDTLGWWRDYRIKQEAREGADHLIACFKRGELNELDTTTHGLEQGPNDTMAKECQWRGICSQCGKGCFIECAKCFAVLLRTGQDHNCPE